MRTLIERIKPEYMAQMEEVYAKYPTLLEIFKEDLSKTFFFTNLRYSTVLELCNTCNIDFRNVGSVFESF